MGKINGRRVILGGLVAGVVCNIFEWVVNGVILRAHWDAAMTALGRPMSYTAGVMSVFICWAFLIGILAVWLYAAIRPRFGAGPKTAVIAGIAMWILVYVQSVTGSAPLGLFPTGLLFTATIAGLIEMVVATLIGAWLYKEEQVEVAAT